MEREAVGEDGHRRAAGRGARGADQEVGAAGRDDAVRGTELGLRLHVVGVLAGLQHVARLAAHQVCAHAHGARAVGLDPAQRLDETGFELAVERRVDGDPAEVRHFRQFALAGEDAVEHVDRGVPGRLGHLAAANVGEHAAVAAVLLRVAVAGAGRERPSRLLEDRQQLLRPRHQFLEIAGAARHGVVQQQVAAGRVPAVFRGGPRFRGAGPPGAAAGRGPQVVDPAAETAPEPDLQGRRERADAPLGPRPVQHRKQHLHRLGAELAVQVEAVGDVGRVRRAGRAGRSVLRFAAALLHRAAAPADAEAVARKGDPGERDGLAPGVEAPEVHLAEGRRLDVLEAERRARIRRGPGALDGGGLEVDGRLPPVEQRLAVVALVPDAGAPVEVAGVHHPQREHFAALPRVGPHHVAAAWAGGVVVRRIDARAVVARRAEPPRLDGRHAQVDAVDGDAVAAGVELVLGGQLAERGGGGADVLVDVAFAAFAAAVLVPFARPVDHRLQRHAGLGERVVRQEPLVGQEVEGLAPVQLPQQSLHAPALARELFGLRLGRFVLGSAL